MIILVLLFTLFLLCCSKLTSEKNVTVSYDSRGGSAVSSQQVKSGGTVETLPVSEKFSYHFDGWYTEADGGGTIFLENTAVTENITVYASWVQAAVVTTLAGSGTNGKDDGTGIAASFSEPKGITVDSEGNVYVVDFANYLIRRITASGVVTTLAGSGSIGLDNGTGTSATFSGPEGVAVDREGNVYVADTDVNLIRKVSTSGVVSTLAGSGYLGSDDGTGTSATFYWPEDIAVDSAGNVYVADTRNNLIRKISPAGVVTTLAGSGTVGKDDGTGTAATFYWPSGIAVDSAGNLYLADTQNHLIRKVSPAGAVTTLAGSGKAGSNDGIGTSASFNYPYGVAVDSAGNVYVADTINHLIRKVSPAGVVTTLAGSGTDGSSNGTGTSASFKSPYGVAVDSTGTVYISDSSNHLIRKIIQ